VQWTGGYAARFLAFFLALGFFRFEGESQPSHLPLTLADRHAEKTERDQTHVVLIKLD
jgi:hypothetical protein